MLFIGMMVLCNRQVRNGYDKQPVEQSATGCLGGISFVAEWY